MFKSVLRLFKLDREKFSVPRSVQKVLKIQQMWPDGVFRVGRKKYSKCFKFEDINYAVASHEDQELMFLQYSQVLNSLDPGAMTKLTINNHRINCSDLAQSVYMPMRGDGHDEMRKEYNTSVIGGVIKHNSITQEKYVTISVHENNKAFTAKREKLLRKLMADNKTEIIIMDPEREYAPLVRALGGSVIQISATSSNHINAMDINSEYGDGANPVTLKSEFILSLCEQLIGSLGAQQKSLIDRCTANVYRHYQQGNYMGIPPTLQDFREELLRQPEPEAKEVALAIELFTDGSLNTFAKQTNVDTSNSLLCYDILDLGKQLLPIGMLVVLDSILNRVTRNREKGISTYIVIDEIYLLFLHEYSANFLFTLWKRVRKYGANCTGITQNVDDLLQSHTARTMLANSEFIVMLNQASTDRIELAKLLGISETQLSYITNVNAACGLLKVGSALVPFTDDFPKDTMMYKLMSTKPGEQVA